MSGIFRRDGGAMTIELVRRLRPAPSAIWPLLTSPAELGSWFARIELDDGGYRVDGGRAHGRILLCEPEHALALEWTADEDEATPAGGATASVLTVTLLPQGRGTRLLLVHAGVGEADAERSRARWSAALDALRAAVR